MSRYSEEVPADDEREAPCKAIDLIINARPRDLGGFSVRRVLPYARRRMVGPFIFFDHIGPAVFEPGKGIDVRPHPHINLATLTWLFDGGLRHRDSLGTDMVIRPGAVNWMTAGRGIAHSERTDDGDREAGHRLHGIQSWVALPDEHEEADPGFFHHTPNELPTLTSDGGAALTLIAGEAYGVESPVQHLSPLFYLQAEMEAETTLAAPNNYTERAIYVVFGEVEIDGAAVREGEMAVLGENAPVRVLAKDRTRLMLLGGEPVGERKIWWNYVSSRPDRIEQAKRDWTAAAQDGFPEGGPFTLPPGEHEHIPLPDDG